MLSSNRKQITQGSLGFQKKSDILVVWPLWTKNSGGLSSPLSGNHSSQFYLSLTHSVCDQYHWHHWVTSCLPNRVLQGLSSYRVNDRSHFISRPEHTYLKFSHSDKRTNIAHSRQGEPPKGKTSQNTTAEGTQHIKGTLPEAPGYRHYMTSSS